MNRIKTGYAAMYMLSATIIVGCAVKKERREAQLPGPNIIYILADDLGYGDLSCYGQQKFTTPHIDKLAEEGMRFTQHYSGSTVCAPSRSALMTGQHTGHTPIRGNKEVQPEGQWPLPAASFTLAEMLKSAGYVTGAFGKWGLGAPGTEGDPNMQGFDRFYGYNCQRLAHHYYPRHLWDNQRKVILESNAEKGSGTYGPDIIHKRALSFIEENRDTSFFLYYPSVIPHAELLAPEAYMRVFRGKYDPEERYEGVDEGPRYRAGAYGSQPEAHAAFAAMIRVLDDQVGDLVMKVRDLGLEGRTIIMFTSDNGPHLEGGADPDYFDSNGPLRGYKRDLYEGGIRVPFLVKWPGKVEPGTVTDHISAFWDVMPTVAKIVQKPVPNDTDGISFLPTLAGVGDQAAHDYLYWEFHEREGRRALRQGAWKAVQYQVKNDPPGEVELYNLEEDIAEEHNLSQEYPERTASMFGKMQSVRTPSDVFGFIPEKGGENR